MGLFAAADMNEIEKLARMSNSTLPQAPKKKPNKGLRQQISQIEETVSEYFGDSRAVLVKSTEQLHDYVSSLIDIGIAAIDTETTGLDRIHDTIVGFSLFHPGENEIYVPNKHIVPVFDVPYRNQISYADAGRELKRLKEHKTKLIFANADFDLAMLYKDYNVDLNDNFFFDVILAWRCLKENEKRNALKILYSKYVAHTDDPKRFSDFFSPDIFPYCNPSIAALYAANDAKITYELFEFERKYLNPEDAHCKKHKFESISKLVWNIEFPLVPVCQNMHRRGAYIDQSAAMMLQKKYIPELDKELQSLREMVQALMDDTKCATHAKKPFKTAESFNPDSVKHVEHLVYDMLKFIPGKDGRKTGKDVLAKYNHPVITKILKCRSLSTLIGTFVEKLPSSVAPDGRIHCEFRQIGADTGRMSSAEPNLQNIPSKHSDIRHMFRATPGYVLLSSDYSQQEPKLTAYISQDENMIQSFKEGRQIYSFIASIAFNKTYEECLEFSPSGEPQPEGKARRTEAKSVVLGILYGRSTKTIAQQLYGKEDWSDEKKEKMAQHVYDSVLKAFPALKKLMLDSQRFVKKFGYVETILGRRRHIPDMQLPEYEFRPMDGYVNPNINPLDISTLDNDDGIPQEIIQKLTAELASYKYYGQVVKRIRELSEVDHIRVISNRFKIQEATRQVVNSIVQGSAADLTKMALLKVENDPEWKRLGGRVLIPVHDELIAEIPIENWKAGGERLSKMMCEAASFLPFPIECDVTASYRWSGLTYPCNHKRPESIDTSNPDEIKWIQYFIVESGYYLPVLKTASGEKPEGEEAYGVNGIYTDELRSSIADYMASHNLKTGSEFIDHIYTVCHTGVYPKNK